MLLRSVARGGTLITAPINRMAVGAFVYYAQSGKRLILLLLGGDKRNQQADIEKAIECWHDYQRRST